MMVIPEQNDAVFREEQRFSLWLRLPLAALMAVVVGLEYFALKQLAAKEGPPEMLPIILLVVAGIILPIVIAALFLVLKLETEVRSDGLYVRYFPIHIHYKRFTAEDLSQYQARQYKPIREYGGWGIRYGRGGKAYNVSGNKGVQLVLKNGKRLLIGSQRPDELVEAISSVMKSR
jgi:hypothetical protein